MTQAADAAALAVQDCPIVGVSSERSAAAPSSRIERTFERRLIADAIDRGPQTAPA